MAYVSFRNQIVTLLKTIKTIGQVHKVQHNNVFWDEYFKNTVKKGQLNAWEVTRIAALQELYSVQNLDGNEPLYQDTDSFRILGRLAYKDSEDEEEHSETQFQVLIDAIIDLFRVNNQLQQGVGDQILLPRTAQAPIIEHRTYGGVLVHYCEIDFEAIERTGG